jgi:phosphoesterase RecJ-like protein
MLTEEQQIFEQIKKAKNILITFGSIWDGDSIASALALFLFLRKLEKNVEIIAEPISPGHDNSGNILSFLPAFDKIENNLKIARKYVISLDTSKSKLDQIKYETLERKLNFIVSLKEGDLKNEDLTLKPGGYNYDLIIVVDTPDIESLGGIYENSPEFFYQTPVINIDHHSSNEEFGQINAIELTAVSTTEIIYTLFENYSRDLIDEDIATCLLAGLIAKTKSFKTPNVTPRSLLIASQLISMGGRREDIVNRLYRSRSINVLKLWGRVLARLNSSSDNQLIWSTIGASDFEKTGALESDLSEVIDELIISIPQAKIITLIYEDINSEEKNKNCKAIIYSIKNINSLSMTKELNPHGGKNFASLVIDKPIAESEKIIIDMIKEKFSKLPL